MNDHNEKNGFKTALENAAKTQQPSDCEERRRLKSKLGVDLPEFELPAGSVPSSSPVHAAVNKDSHANPAPPPVQKSETDRFFDIFKLHADYSSINLSKKKTAPPLAEIVSDPNFMELVEEFGNILTSIPNGLIPDDVKYRCKRIYGNLSKEFTPRITPEIENSLNELLPWLGRNCAVIAGVNLGLAVAARDLLYMLENASYLEKAPAQAYNEGETIDREGSQPMPPNTKHAAAAVTGQKKSKSRHRPEYFASRREGMKTVAVPLPEELVNALNLVAKNEGTTVKDMITAFIVEKTKNVMPKEERQKIVEKELVRIRARYGADNTPAALP